MTRTVSRLAYPASASHPGPPKCSPRKGSGHRQKAGRHANGIALTASISDTSPSESPADARSPRIGSNRSAGPAHRPRNTDPRIRSGNPACMPPTPTRGTGQPRGAASAPASTEAMRTAARQTRTAAHPSGQRHRNQCTAPPPGQNQARRPRPARTAPSSLHRRAPSGTGIGTGTGTHMVPLPMPQPGLVALPILLADAWPGADHRG